MRDRLPSSFAAAMLFVACAAAPAAAQQPALVALDPGIYLVDVDVLENASDGGGVFGSFARPGARARTLTEPERQLVAALARDPALACVAARPGSMLRRWRYDGAPLPNDGERPGSAAGTDGSDSRGASGAGAFGAAVFDGGVTGSVPRIIEQPRDASIDPLGNTFTVQAAAAEPLAYQWTRDGAPLADGDLGSAAIVSGAQSATLVIVGATLAEAGNYTCTVTGAFGSVTSEAGRLGTFVASAAPAAAVELRLGVAPNPVRRAAAFAFELPAAGRASVQLYDVTGRRIVTLANGTFEAGAHDVLWDLRDAAGVRVRPGVFLARIVMGRRSVQRSVVVVE
jgi:hypothetical protein